MSTHSKLITLTIIFILLTACGNSESTVPSAEPIADPGTASLAPSIPTQTHVSPTDIQTPIDLSIEVPQGDPATIDGTLSPREWDRAREEKLVGGGKLLLMHDGIYLYLGIRSDVLGLGSICTDQGDQISVLHSSASLGTAVYKKGSEGWERTRNFAWTNSNTTHLEKEGWRASDGNTGDDKEMEFQIAMSEDMMRLAVTYLESPGYNSAVVWPSSLADDCRNIELIQGDAPSKLQFSPQTWITVRTTKTSAMLPTGSGGGVIAFTSEQDGNMDIYLMNADGSNPQRLTNHPGEDYWPTWSPDGEQIAFASQRDGDFEIYTLDVTNTLKGIDDTSLRRLTHESGDDLEPAWSPDGTKIAFMVHRDGKTEIYSMNADGGDRHRLTEGDDDNYLPKWSADGAQIVFVSERDGNPEIYTMRADGGDQRRLTDNPSDDLYPSWSPDGTQITFYSVRDEHPGLYVMDIDGNNPHRLTHDDAAVWVSDWSPNGNRIAFTSDQTGSREIYILEVVSGNLQRLTNNHVLDGIPAWQPQSTGKGASVGNTRTRPIDSMVMVAVPAGTFQMGSTLADVDDAIALCKEHYSICNRWYYMREYPQHSVSLEGFWLDRTEVTNAQYHQCVDDGICQEPSECKKGELTYADAEKTDHPVVCVDWRDAQTYCQWAGARMPTEAEWEYAFRGEDGSTYPWGNIFDGEKLNYCDINCEAPHADDRFDDGYAKTSPVTHYYDGAGWSDALGMSGNVSEWVADWLGDFTPEAELNPTGPEEGSEKLVKGCSWFFHPTYCRGTVRASVSPDTRFDYLGFRCAGSVDE